ncbi:MAG: type II toxin-antitoxin system VapC family toxin [Gemmataceae bacterium]|nr:type II toxin-antitoxin system VapC family toxin [Gemmataceae bacterium]
MRRYLLDTNSASDLINDRRGVRERVRAARVAGGRIGTGIPAVAELYYGVEYSSTRDANLRDLRRGLEELVIWPFDLAAAELYGRLFADLRRRGRLMQPVDIMLAAIALTLGNTTVVSADSDLAAVPGSAVENWAAAP